MTDPEEIQAACRRVVEAKERKRAELMLELALEKLAELDGMEALRKRLLIHVEAATWY